MKTKTIAAIVLTLLGVLIAFYVLVESSIKTTPAKVRPFNILVLGNCSLRKDFLSIYDKSKNTTPLLAEFFKNNSIVFKNAFNSQAWSNFSNYSVLYFEKDLLKSAGYQSLGEYKDSRFLRIPRRRNFDKATEYRKMRLQMYQRKTREIDPDALKRVKEEWLSGINASEHSHHLLQVNEGLEGVYQRIDRHSKNKPWYLHVHSKYMHYPYIDHLNNPSGWDRNLSESSKKLVEKYRNNFDQFPEKLPLLFYLFNDIELARRHPYVQENYSGDLKSASKIALAGLVANPTLLKLWSESEGFEEDLEILKQVYASKVVFYDKLIGQLLNRLKAKGHLENTLVVFVGDHGEEFMESGQLSHFDNVNDIALTLPMAIKWPDDFKFQNIVIEDQFHFGELVKILRQVVQGGKEPEKLLASMDPASSQYIISRDCNNTQFSVRYLNKWKLVIDYRSNSKTLFDLEADPMELTDVSGKFPDRVDWLFREFLERYSSFEKPSMKECLPWPEL